MPEVLRPAGYGPLPTAAELRAMPIGGFWYKHPSVQGSVAACDRNGMFIVLYKEDTIVPDARNPKKTVTKTRPKGWGPLPTQEEIDAHNRNSGDAEGEALWLVRDDDGIIDTLYAPAPEEFGYYLAAKAADPEGDAVEVVYDVEVEKIRPKGWGPAPTPAEYKAHTEAHPVGGEGQWMCKWSDGSFWITEKVYYGQPQARAIDMNGDDVEVRYTEED